MKGNNIQFVVSYSYLSISIWFISHETTFKIIQIHFPSHDKEISIESVSLVIFLIREKSVVRSYIFVVITVLGFVHVLDFPFVTVIVMSGQ